MDKYYLNGVDLESFGIIPGEHRDSNLAIAGLFDLPARIGDTHRVWSTGVEPYVRPDEMFFGGIDIRFNGIIEASNQRAVIESFRAFVTEINGFKTLVNFSTGFGDFEVYVKNQMTATVITDQHALLDMTLRVPVVNLEGVIPEADGEEGIDKISFEALGIFLLQHDMQYHRAATQPGETSVYGREPSRITSPDLNSYTLRFMINRPNLTSFIETIQSLRQLLSNPFKRLLNLGDGLLRDVFCKDGFQVSGVMVEDHQVTAFLDITFVEVTSYTDYSALTEDGTYLTDKNGLKLIFK